MHKIHRTSCLILSAVLLASCTQTDSKPMERKTTEKIPAGYSRATFAGGCFWCIESAFLDLDGVKEVTSGYSGGQKPNPTYEEVCTGTTGHVEAIQILFNPDIISYAELVDIFWRQFDPTDDGGSFADRGSQYQSVIFYHDEFQKNTAERSKEQLRQSHIFDKPLVTKIIAYTNFYPAEEYHQKYCRKNPAQYYNYRSASGRDQFIKSVWGEIGLEQYAKKNIDSSRKQLSDIQYHVTAQCGTEPPFQNEFWNNHKEGIYVDILSGEPLFLSRDKFDSGSGWPSFTKPIDARFLIKKTDTSASMERVEVRSKNGGSHLGHVFADGPAPSNLRYCINSAALRFISKETMEKEGYGFLLWMFQ